MPASPNASQDPNIPESNSHTLDHGDGHYTVIGIAADARVNGPRRDTAMMYLPFWWQPPFGPVFLIRGRSVSASEIKQAHQLRRASIWPELHGGVTCKRFIYFAVSQEKSDCFGVA